jgi:hypothetical protein
VLHDVVAPATNIAAPAAIAKTRSFDGLECWQFSFEMMIGFMATASLQAARQFARKPQASHFKDIPGLFGIGNPPRLVASCTKKQRGLSFCTIEAPQ